MSAVVSKHPFPITTPQRRDWLLPVMLAPSLYVMLSFAVYWGSGSAMLCSPPLLLVIGILAIIYGARSIYRENHESRHRQVCQYCALLTLIYLQLLLPRLWGWPAN
ncbi:hypothetical protein [Cerasicoccus arenae]|uniref:Uncharacterized protein n=1 Tax=Cerasicoccus arenae TaxID=424488 RepID=A0A8J3D7Z6_9BACT|nr:hypothetical protein [Cerasicoccus arenae]MBK1859808.1 hypothetical protein [Cerasicoccus arenae]GHB93692.1 hypothetical protein GCM10007047_06490 [Cerasicoccus arenae]